MVEAEDCPSIPSNMQFLNHLDKQRRSFRKHLFSSTSSPRQALRRLLGRELDQPPQVRPSKAVTREDIMVEMIFLNEHGVQLLPPLSVQALYDYEDPDQLSLCFRKGDIIQVSAELENGWWDGVLKNRRGWFPSSYVTKMSDRAMPRDVDCSQQRSECPSMGVRVTNSASVPAVALNHPGIQAAYQPQVSRQSWTVGDDAAFTVGPLRQEETPPLPTMPSRLQAVDCSQQRLGSLSVDAVPRVTNNAFAPTAALQPPGPQAFRRSRASRQSWTPGDEAEFTVASLQQTENPPLPAMPSLLETTWPWLRGSAHSVESDRPGARFGGGLRWSGMATAGSSDSLARSPKQYVDPKRKPPAQNGTAILPFHACQPHKLILCSLCKDPNPSKKRASVISAASVPKRQLPAFFAVPKHQALTLYHRYRQMRRLKHRHKKELARADQLIVQESPGAVEYRKWVQGDYQADCRELRRHWHGQRDGDAVDNDGAPLGWRDLLF